MGRIVVGTDGSRSACAAVAWAAREAALRGVELHVIHAWTPGLAAYPSPWYTPSDVGVEASDRGLADDRPARICEGAREQANAAAPGIDVRCEAIEGGSTQVLLDQSADADLLVVGARGHGGFIGLVLGSVSDQCARHAHIPVVVVPGTARARGPDAQPGWAGRRPSRASSAGGRSARSRCSGSCPRSGGARSRGSSSASDTLAARGRQWCTGERPTRSSTRSRRRPATSRSASTCASPAAPS